MLHQARAFALSGTAAVLLCLGTAGCGGSTAPTSATPSPTPMLITEGVWTLPYTPFTPLAAGRREFTTSRAGTLEITVEWTFATNTIEVIVARGACSFQQVAFNECDFVHRTRGVEPKPRRVSLSGQPAGTYTLFIANAGPSGESVSFQVVLTPQG